MVQKELLAWMSYLIQWILYSILYSGEGPTPKFFPYHIWKAYDLINNEGPIGRKALSQALGIGEGSTRTIIDKMIKNGSINNTQRGVVLTEHGVKQFQNSGIVVTPIRLKEITVFGSRLCGPCKRDGQSCQYGI